MARSDLVGLHEASAGVGLRWVCGRTSLGGTTVGTWAWGPTLLRTIEAANLMTAHRVADFNAEKGATSPLR